VRIAQPYASPTSTVDYVPLPTWNGLVEAGQPKKLDLSAAMHKLRTILNSVVRHNRPWHTQAA